MNDNTFLQLTVEDGDKCLVAVSAITDIMPMENDVQSARGIMSAVCTTNDDLVYVRESVAEIANYLAVRNRE